MEARDSGLLEQYFRTHAKSRELHQRAAKLFAADGVTHFARLFDPFRPYITHAAGSRKWDVDGNEYIDYVMGHGALLLGHSHPAVVKAVQEQMQKGVLYGDSHELEIEWAELIQKMLPNAERVEFFACGNEANLMAVQLSRAFTGRKKILRFQNHFHGWGDELAAPTEPGILRENVVLIPPNDLPRLEAELAKEEYAILLTEAGGAWMSGRDPLDINFVRSIPDLTRKYGTVWLLDEVVTGFREAPGGWQQVIGVNPDLTTLGKCVGGGLSVGAMAGRADIMDSFSPKSPLERRIRHSGTWNANPLTAAAGIAACKLYIDGEPQRAAADTAAMLRAAGNRALREQGVSGFFYGRSIVHLYLGPFDYEPENDTLPPTRDLQKLFNPQMAPVYNRLSLELLQHGVANMVGMLFVLSAVHSKQDIDETIKALGKSIENMQAEQLLPLRRG